MNYKALEQFKIRMNDDLYIVHQDSIWQLERQVAEIIWVTNGTDAIGIDRQDFVNLFKAI